MSSSSLPSPSGLTRWWRSYAQGGRIDWSGWRTFAIAVLALGAALVLALYSGTAAQDGNVWLAGTTALGALVVAGWVAVTIVPVLARRTTLRWIRYRVDYRLTREGVVYLGAVFILTLAALNSGNNLLFMMLAALLAGILISGMISHAVLSGIELRLDLPEHIFAGRPILALVELVNHKQLLPSFSLTLVGDKAKAASSSGAGEIFARPIYFPYVPRRQAVQQSVELVFARRGAYRQDALGLRTKFPFGFLQKTRRIDSQKEAIVYPSIEPSREFHEVLPLLMGELESFQRGRGHDLYAIRDYQTSDSARHVDWKASAKTGVLQVREFAREDERRVLLVLDSVMAPSQNRAALFERGVTLCASLAWQFYQINSVLGFRTADMETPMAPASEIIYEVLRNLAVAESTETERGRPLLDELTDLPQTFKIVVTAKPHGSIPTSLWSSSYILFLDR
jgi:uncharacterized protein (DUF58 family)